MKKTIDKTHPEILAFWDYEKNNVLKHKNGNNYKPSDFVAGSHKKVWWLCEEHGSYEQEIRCKANRNHGCPVCGRKILLESRHKTIIKKRGSLADSNPELLNKWDYEKNSIKPTEITKGYRQKVWFYCEKHNYSYQAYILNQLKGQGCKYCGFKDTHLVDSIVKTHPEILKYWDYEKNKMLNIFPENIRFKSGEDVWWICEEHGSFRQRVSNRTRGFYGIKKTGCSKCASSKHEKVIIKFLDNNEIEYEFQKSFDDLYYKKKLYFDFYIPSFNLVIEYNGEQHENIMRFYDKKRAVTELELSQIRDEIKKEYCSKNEISLLIIPFCRKEQIKSVLDKILASEPENIKEIVEKLNTNSK